MKIRLFPEQFLQHNTCFGLFKLNGSGSLDLPVTIEADVGVPIHIIHSDCDQLAYLSGLIVLQVWAMGITELGIPPMERRALLVLTDKPGRFAEAYLQLHIPAQRVKELAVQRRVRLFEKTGTVPTGKAAYWDSYVRPEDGRTRLHNLFPAYQILRVGGTPKVLAGREHLGRGDEAGPALLITRRSDRDALQALTERYHPLLAISDARGTTIPVSSIRIPSIFHHESIFDPELARQDAGKVVLCCLPDAPFEDFCRQARLCVAEPHEDGNTTQVWAHVDSALQALMERLDQRWNRVVLEIHRAAFRLRNLLLSLPVGISSFEKALLASGLPPSLSHDWSASALLHTLENRIPEMSALGEGEVLILREVVDGFRRLADLLQHDSPKKELLVSAVVGSLSKSRRVVLLVNSPSVASGLKWVARLPEPLGLGFSPGDVTARTPRDAQPLGPDEDCIIHEAFDPHDIFSLLARSGPRRITLILSRNELRFVAERFLRARRLSPDHPANQILLCPIFEQLDRLEPMNRIARRNRTSTLFSDSEFEKVIRMFNQGPPDIYHGRVLVDEPDSTGVETATETAAYLVKLEGQNAVFLQVGGRISYLRDDETITTGLADTIEPGDRLIIVSPQARESIAHRILSAKRGEETDDAAGVTIKHWQVELTTGIARSALTYREILRRIQQLGSQRISADVIGQWARGDVFGPLDAYDIRRIGQVIDSSWIFENWQRIGWALLVVRSGNRLLGRQITQIIQRAAAGDYGLARQDEEFLQQVGITIGELQDAVTLLTVEAVSRDAKVVPIDQIGTVLPF